jgi:hypothetical protein
VTLRRFQPTGALFRLMLRTRQIVTQRSNTTIEMPIKAELDSPIGTLFVMRSKHRCLPEYSRIRRTNGRKVAPGRIDGICASVNKS